MTNFNQKQTDEKEKGQHFLLSAGARSLSLKKVFRMTDDQAWETFKTIRWPEAVACPYCEYDGPMYFIKTRKIWRCKNKQNKKQDVEKAIWYLRMMIGDDPREQGQ